MLCNLEKHFTAKSLPPQKGKHVKRKKKKGKVSSCLTHSLTPSAHSGAPPPPRQNSLGRGKKKEGAGEEKEEKGLREMGGGGKGWAEIGNNALLSLSTHV